MPTKLFRTETSYGEIVTDYYIDESGQPFAVEERYEMMFHGWGDHIGTPGRLTGTRQYSVSFSQLREAAERKRLDALAKIDETNWKDLVRAAGKTRKRKNAR